MHGQMDLQISVQTWWKSHHIKQHGGRLTISPIQVSYDPNELKQLGEKVKHDNRYKWLTFGTIKQVLKLRLNNKNRSRKKQTHPIRCFKQTGVTQSNLITIKRRGHKPDSNIIFSSCNIQSLKNKELQVSGLINDYALDFLVVTETWLNAKQDQLKDNTILNKDRLTMLTANRTNSNRGGGLALIYKSKYKATTTTKGNRPTFEFATWELKLKNGTLTVHGIYHPPPSLRNKMTVSVQKTSLGVCCACCQFSLYYLCHVGYSSSGECTKLGFILRERGLGPLCNLRG